MTCNISYVLPIRVARAMGAEMAELLEWLANHVELIVVDGSDSTVFDRHSRCGGSHVPMSHVPVNADLGEFVNGKVAGVVTGMRRASHDAMIIADDDVRYDQAALLEDGRGSRARRRGAAAELLRTAAVACAASIPLARLLNRVTGGDWPGTMGVRRSILAKTEGYDGNVLFENLELVRP